MHPEITDIRRLLPETYSEAALESLEALVTRYQNFLTGITTAEWPGEYYTEHLQVIEAALHDARYGSNERQRERGFHHALTSLLEDMDEFSRNYSQPDSL